MLLFKLWIFEFDISSLFAFLIGILFGFALLALIYAVLVLISSRKQKYVVASATEVSDEELLEIIDNANQAFKDKQLIGAKGTISHAKDICISLVKDISRKYYPKSKRPFAELSVDEVLQLTVYISNRINEIIDKPALRLLKKVKISTILSMGDVKKSIDDSTLMKLTKKYKVKKIVNTVLGALNVVNPVYWFRKLVMNKSLDFAMKKMCEVVISVVGEETIKIYSKRVFNEEKIIDSGILEKITDIDEEMKDVTDEEIDQYLAGELVDKKRR